MQKHARTITEHARLCIPDIVNASNADDLFKRFYGKRPSLFYFGRGALWHAMKAMALSETDNIIVPAYHCGVEIETIVMAGTHVRYYEVQEDLTIDQNGLASLMDAGTKALLLIHYFGFPHPVETIKQLCVSRNIFLIEDCCHALFSCYRGKPLGSFGDMAIFSQRKTLPLPDGGALLVNNPALKTPPPTGNPGEFVAIKKALGMVARTTFHLDKGTKLPPPLSIIAATVDRIIAKRVGIRYSAGQEVTEDRCTLAMSQTSTWFMNGIRPALIIEKRRSNYLWLARNLRNSTCVKLMKNELPDGVCPLFFPIMIKGCNRQQFQDRLFSAGITTFIFGKELHESLPAHRFPGAEKLSQRVLCLPVHQGLSHSELAYMVNTILRITQEFEHGDHR